MTKHPLSYTTIVLLLPMQIILHTIDTNATGNPSLEYGSLVAASEAIYVPNADGSSSNDNRRNTWCGVHYLITTHPSEQIRHHLFIQRIYTSYGRVYCRYCNGWGWVGGTTSNFIHKLYIFYIRMRVDIGL